MEDGVNHSGSRTVSFFRSLPKKHPTCYGIYNDNRPRPQYQGGEYMWLWRRAPSLGISSGETFGWKKKKNSHLEIPRFNKHRYKYK